MTVYPTPYNGNFTLNITTTDAGEMTLAIYDLMGREVWSTGAIDINGSYSNSINVGDLGIGMYIIKLQTNNGVKTQKLEIVK